MAKPNSDLRNAIAGLKIKAPYDLRSQGKPAFEAPQNKLTQAEVTQSQEPQRKDPQSQDPQFKEPHQDSAQTEVPRIGVAPVSETESSQRGYFKLAHSVFGNPLLRTLPGDAFRVFLWMSSRAWRFEDSDGSLHASVSFISAGAGVSESTVSRCLLLLKDKCLIELMELNYKKGNTWRVEPLACAPPSGPNGSGGGHRTLERPRAEEPPVAVPQTEDGATSKRASTSPNLRWEPPQSEGEERTPNPFQVTPKHTLSKACMPSEDLNAYLDSVRAPGKRESERQALGKLLSFYPNSEVAEALRYLSAFGLPGSGEPCHSPMAFLSQAMDRVLEEARSALSAEHDRNLKRETAERQSRLQAENEAREEREFRKKREAFLQAFPSSQEQEAFFDHSRLKLKGSPFKGEALKSIAICSWWDETRNPSTGTMPKQIE